MTFDMKNLFETAQRIQSEVARVKDELAAKTVEGEAGGGLVRCVADGRGDVRSVTIDPAIMGDRKMIEDLTVAAVNVALERARLLAQEDLARATAGLPLPPGMLGG